MKKRVLITGASGFVGSHLVKNLLFEGWKVSIVAREASDLGSIINLKDKIDVLLYRGDFTELLNFFNKTNPSIVVHLAAKFIAEHKAEDIKFLVESNIEFGTSILEAMKLANIKYFINTSTSWQNFKNEDYNPVCLYASTKKAFEDIITFYEKAHGIRCLTLKLFDTYGPGDRRNKLFFMLRRVAANQQTLRMSEGEQLLDLVYIDDVIDAYRTAMALIENKENHSSVKEYAVSSGEHIALKEIVKVFNDLSEKKVLVEWGAKPYRLREVMVPWTKYVLLPGWKAKTPFKEGIAKLLKSESWETI